MNTIRLGLAGVLLLTTLGTAGCHPQVDRGYELEVGGCAPAHVWQDPTSSALAITTDGCLSTVDPIRRLAGIAWLHLPDDIHIVRIRTAGHDSAPTVLTRADLERRHGSIPRRERGDEIWLLLPVGLLAYWSLIALAAYGTARAGVFVAFVRSRRH